jgi:hypothetical protein
MNIIDWSQRGTDDLAALCVAHPQQWAEINAAEQDITYKLERHPLKHSQEVSEGLRRIISWPLVAYFSVDGNKIEIDAVAWIG